jgi:hypothetical protein
MMTANQPAEGGAATILPQQLFEWSNLQYWTHAGRYVNPAATVGTTGTDTNHYTGK